MKEKYRKPFMAILPMVALAVSLPLGAMGTCLSSPFPGGDEDAGISSTNSSSSQGHGAPLMTSSLSNNCYFGYHKTNVLEANETTKRITFTLSPSDVSDKNIIVTSSQPSEISVSSRIIKSGEPVDLCLKSPFGGVVTITAQSEIMPNVGCSVSAKVVNLDDAGTSGLTIVWNNNGSYQVGDGSKGAYSGRVRDIIIPKYYNDGTHGTAEVTAIADDGLCGSGATTVFIPNSVRTIGSNAFWNVFLTSITIPSSVTSICDNSFGACYAVQSITVDASNSNYSSVDGVLFNKNKSQLILYPEGKSSPSSYSIPFSVTSLGTFAFDGSKLESISIPNSVRTIGSYAFESCRNLESLYIPSSVTNLSGSNFGYCDNLTSITVSSANQYYASFDGILFNKSENEIICYPLGKKISSNYTTPSYVSKIGAFAFVLHQEVVNLTISTSVTDIEMYAFRDFYGLSTVRIPSTVTYIGPFAFEGAAGTLFCQAQSRPSGWSSSWTTAEDIRWGSRYY